MKTLVIGSQGQLGQDLMRALGDSASGLTHQDLDVTDGVAVQQTIDALEPECVINTAAFHRVDDCEANPSLAMAVNAMGAFNVARASANAGAPSCLVAYGEANARALATSLIEGHLVELSRARVTRDADLFTRSPS